MLPEVNSVLSKKISMNKMGALQYLIDGLEDYYDAIGYESSVREIYSLAKKWKLPKPKLASPKLSPGFPYERGLVVKQSSIGIVVDGNKLGVKNILAATKVIESMTHPLTDFSGKKIPVCQEAQ